MPTPTLSREEYQALVEQSPVLIWRSDLTMGCDYFNQQWLAFTGRTYEEEFGNGWAEAVHPDDYSRCLAIYTEAFKRREIFEMEYRLRRHDGVYRWIFDRGVPFNGPTGEFAGYIGSCNDITERVEARAKEVELNLLRGLVPICAWCKKVRDDAGYWEQVEEYVSTHSALRFTHGMCPTCYHQRIQG